MKLWLLKQKQTQQWDSPVTTADAVYALAGYGYGISASRRHVVPVTIHRAMSRHYNLPASVYLEKVLLIFFLCNVALFVSAQSHMEKGLQSISRSSTEAIINFLAGDELQGQKSSLIF